MGREENPAKISFFSCKVRFIFLLLALLASMQVYLFTIQLYNPYLYTLGFSAIGFCLLTIFDRYLYQPLAAKREIKIPNVINFVVKTLIYLLFFFTVLKINFGIDITPLLTTSAVLSFVLGLALQETLTNLFAGLAISMENLYKVGDWIRVANLEGQVVDISWRATRVLTIENNYLTIPNSKISKDDILNYNAPNDISALWIEVDLPYALAPNRVKEVIHENLRRMRMLLAEPKPEVVLKEFKDSSILYGVKVWFHDWEQKIAIGDEVRTVLWYAFKRNQIDFPYPVRDVYLHEVKKVNRQDRVEEHVNFLAALELFKNQSEEVLRAIGEVLEKKHYGRGETLFLEDDEGDSLFIITRGRIAIIKENHTIAELEKDHFFGENSLLTGNKRTATAKALKDSDCLCLDKENFRHILMEHGEIIDKIAEVMAAREVETSRIMDEQGQKISDAQSARQASETAKNQLISRIRNFFSV